MNRKLLSFIVAVLVAPTVNATPTTNGGADYVAECSAAGVPVPPDWTSPLWRFNGALPDVFISTTRDAEVYFFESRAPEGVCIALPRFQRGTDTIKLLGIICQGTATGNACFWDNSFPNGRSFDIDRNEFVPIVGPPGESFSGGADLENAEGGVCSSCHAGENAFIIHPGTALDLGDRLLKPDRWHNPIVADSWPDNPGPSNQLQGIQLGPGDASCLACHGEGGHRFPQVSTEIAGYCGELRTALERTMPPGNVGSPAYAKHSMALMDACRTAPMTPPPLPPQTPLDPALLSVVLD